MSIPTISITTRQCSLGEEVEFKFGEGVNGTLKFTLIGGTKEEHAGEIKEAFELAGKIKEEVERWRQPHYLTPITFGKRIKYAKIEAVSDCRLEQRDIIQSMERICSKVSVFQKKSWIKWAVEQECRYVSTEVKTYLTMMCHDHTIVGFCTTQTLEQDVRILSISVDSEYFAKHQANNREFILNCMLEVVRCQAKRQEKNTISIYDALYRDAWGELPYKNPNYKEKFEDGRHFVTFDVPQVVSATCTEPKGVSSTRKCNKAEHWLQLDATPRSSHDDSQRASFSEEEDFETPPSEIALALIEREKVKIPVAHKIFTKVRGITKQLITSLHDYTHSHYGVHAHRPPFSGGEKKESKALQGETK